MKPAEQIMSCVEAIVTEIEILDAATAGHFRQIEDREAYDIIARIERRLAQQQEPVE